MLGTKFTMELDFFMSKLKEKGILTIISDEQDRKFDIIRYLKNWEKEL